jgi:hypothetical protein
MCERSGVLYTRIFTRYGRFSGYGLLTFEMNNDLDELAAMLDSLSATTPASVPPSQRPQSVAPSMEDLASLMDDLAGGNQELNSMLGMRPPQRASVSVSSAELAALMNDLGGAPAGVY